MSTAVLEAHPVTTRAQSLGALSAQVAAATSWPPCAAEGPRLIGQSIEAISALPRAQRGDDVGEAAGLLVAAIIRAGWVDQPAEAATIARAEAGFGSNWTGILVGLLQAPAWQLKAAPPFERAPRFLWRALATSYFHLPAALSVSGQADALARQQAVRLKELARLAEMNPGSRAVREAAAACEEAGDCAILANAPARLPEILALRARIRIALDRGSAVIAPLALPRVDRRLKIGAIVGSLSDARRARSVVPWIEHLDATRFQVIAYHGGAPEAGWADYLAEREVELRRLEGGAAEQLRQLGDEALDVAFFATRATDGRDPVLRLLDQRIAPVQIAVDEFAGSTGCPHADYVFCEDAAAAAGWASRISERVLVAPWSGVRRSVRARRPVSDRVWSRAGLGWSAETVLFASAAPFALISPEWADRAARILAAVPDARLLLCSCASEDAGAAGVERASATVEPALVRHGVDTDRLLVANEGFADLNEFVAFLRLADIYLDAHPTGDAEGPRLALEAGVVPVAVRPLAGNAATVAQDLVRLGLSGCLAATESEAVDLAVRLASDRGWRLALRRDLDAALARPANFHDPLAFGERVGRLLEAAFDAAEAAAPRSATLALSPSRPAEAVVAEAAGQLVAGHAADALPALADALATNAVHPQLRPLYYEALIGAGQARRARIGLEAAVERNVADAETLRLLAQAYLKLDRRQEANDTLRASLQLDAQSPRAWALLHELAASHGFHDLAAEISQYQKAIDGAASRNRPPSVASPLRYGSAPS
jgi:predicted O-linked N-acetylglucosamine transferase (SPINDLY family)